MKKALKNFNKAPDPTSILSEDFVLETRPGLLKLFELEPNSKNENKYEETSFDPLKNLEEIPDAIWKVITYGHREWNIPDQATCKVQVGLYMRKSKMTILPPEKNVLCRIVLNYGHDERYLHQDIYVSDSGRKSYSIVKETVARANSAILLGPSLISDHGLYIKSDTHVNLIPEYIPVGIAHSKLSPNAGKTSTIRARNYRRITVVLDYRGTDDMIEKFMEDLEGQNEDNPLAGLISKLTGKDSNVKIPKNPKSLNSFVDSLKKKFMESK